MTAHKPDPAYFVITAKDKSQILPALGKKYLTNKIISWEITYSIDSMDTFSVSIANPDLTLLDHPMLHIGAVWKVRFGTHDNLAESSNWVVTTRQGWTTLTVTGESEDERKLTVKQRQQKWTRKRLSDIATSLFKQAGLIPVVDDTKTRLAVVMRGDETPWQFLKRKADETEFPYAVYARRGKGYFVRQGTHKAPCYLLAAPTGNMPATPSKPKLAQIAQNTPQPQATESLLIGEPRLQQGTPNRTEQETVRGFDPLAKKSFTVTADSRTSQQTLLAGRPALATIAHAIGLPRPAFGASAETGRGTPTAKSTKTLAQNQVDSRFAKKQMEADTLTCTVVGNPALVPGEVLFLQCGAQTVAGRWLLREARHLAQGGGYTTELTLIRNAEEAPTSARVSRPIAASQKRAPVNRKKLTPKVKKEEKVYIPHKGKFREGYVDDKGKAHLR